MPRWSALLLFPFVPTIAARRLQASRIALLVPFVVCTAVALYLWASGVTLDDAWLSGASLFRVLAGLAIGGLAAAWVGARVTGRVATFGELAGPCCAAAGWAPCVFFCLVTIGNAAHAGAAAGVYAGIGLLIWGVAAGMGIVGGDTEPEPGRLLVASCFGLGGVLIGLWAALAAPPEPWVQAVRAPVTEAPIRAGDVLLVRTEKAGSSEGLFLLVREGTREAIIARRARNGSLTPLGEIQLGPEMLQDWNTAGRVFFQYGAEGGQSVADREQRPKTSPD
ncbi:MAG: hypothetical protein ACYTHK_19260 [Planctomycetota bacterium]